MKVKSLSHPREYEIYLIVILACTSLMTNDAEYLFISSLAIYISSLEKCIFHLFAHFSLGYLS